VTFEPLDRTAEALPDETLLDAARRARVPLGNACGGIGICARCRVRVVAGEANHSPPTSIERRVIRERGLAEDERLACQAVVEGDVSITTPYW
jgi:ferredoxin